MRPYAEVVGDPIAQSKSPLIHGHWLRRAGIDADYVRTRVLVEDLAAHFDKRRRDPNWRGCNITIPHKVAAMDLVDEVQPSARVIGAINCLRSSGGRLIGFNSDVDGIAAALRGTGAQGQKAVVIGAGGAARAAIAYLAGEAVAEIVILARVPAKAEPLLHLAPGLARTTSLANAGSAIDGARIVVNASPLGMTGSPPMPGALLASLGRALSGATFFDMVYNPLDTRFLEHGRRTGRSVDGLTMLIGQARAAFTAFFGQSPSDDETELRALLTEGSAAEAQKP